MSSLLPTCFARKLKTLAGAHATFASYRTYQWLPVKTLGKAGIVEDDSTVAPIIKAALNSEMAALGLTEVKEGADLQVAAFAATTSIPQLEAVIFPGDCVDFETPIATMGRYNKGTLAINLTIPEPRIGLLPSHRRHRRQAWLGTEENPECDGSAVQQISYEKRRSATAARSAPVVVRPSFRINEQPAGSNKVSAGAAPRAGGPGTVTSCRQHPYGRTGQNFAPPPLARTLQFQDGNGCRYDSIHVRHRNLALRRHRTRSRAPRRPLGCVSGRER
jgi:hypothetical protein